MANQLKMADIQALLALHGRGWSQRRIARELLIDRETVARHIGLACAAAAKPASAPPGSEGVEGSNPASAPSGSNGTMEDVDGSKPASPPRAPSGSGTGISSPTSAAWAWREIIGEKLEQGLQAQRIYQDLLEHGYAGSYYSVRRLVKKLTAWTEPPVRRMECSPGAEAQVDFGRGAPVVRDSIQHVGGIGVP